MLGARKAHLWLCANGYTSYHRFEVKHFNQGKILSVPPHHLRVHEELKATYGTALELHEFPEQTEKETH